MDVKHDDRFISVIGESKNSSTKANQARMMSTTTVTYSRPSPALIKCQVFYSKDTVKIGGMSIADYIFADVTDVSGQDNTNACEGMSSIAFGQSHAEESRRLRAKSALVEEVCWQNTCFLPCFSMRVSLPVFTSAQCTNDVRQSFT